MSQTPGWYPAPDGTKRLRYWNGVEWTEHFAEPPAAPVAAERSGSNSAAGRSARPRRAELGAGVKKLPLRTRVGLGLFGVFGLIALLSNGVGGLLVLAGTVALVTALYSNISGRRSWLRLPSKKSSAAAMAASLVVIFVGIALPSPHRGVDD